MRAVWGPYRESQGQNDPREPPRYNPEQRAIATGRNPRRPWLKHGDSHGHERRPEAQLESGRRRRGMRRNKSATQLKASDRAKPRSVSTAPRH